MKRLILAALCAVGLALASASQAYARVTIHVDLDTQRMRVVKPDGESLFFNLGPHPPRLWPEDIELAHRLWLEVSSKGPGAKLHHRDIIGVALRRMKAELHSDRAHEVLEDIMREVG